jgi:hypothetical protein
LFSTTWKPSFRGRKGAKVKKEDTSKNYFTVRVSDATTLGLLYDLFYTNAFESMNVLLNKIIDVGIVDFARKYLHKHIPTTPANQSSATIHDIPRALKQVEHTTDDMFVMAGISEYMLTTIFNVKYAELSGQKVSAEDLHSGIYSELPPNLQAIKQEIVRQHSKRSSK